MKAVLISIHPTYCELIAIQHKTLEIRKRRPKLETPFKCYIYQSKHRWVYKLLENLRSFSWIETIIEGQGKVIGEFICDGIRSFDVPYPAYQKELDPSILKESCLTYYQLHRYAYHDKLYGWHISDLKIYDKPKPLSALESYECSVKWENGYPMPTHEIKRAPQSWYYVKEVQS